MEKLLARMERRFGRHAPQGIILWIVGISGALHLLVFARPQAVSLLWLDADAVLRGEVWRVLTFLFAPAGPLDLWGVIWAGFWLLFLYTIGTSLEAQWGSFRFDLFFFAGALGTLAVGFLLGPVSGWFIGEAMLLAFAVEFPDYEVLLLILPVKVKFLGLLSAGLMAWQLVTGSLPAQAAIAVAFGDFLLFCGPALAARLRGRRSSSRRKAATAGFAPAPRKPRVCARCGKSDADDPTLEFRVCDCQERCGGKLTEYCIEHARAH
ncbi:MAG TPA: rhomboid family intramembrane serine protease [Myxococcales bacterium]|nr:rhomboid family intramembrane serine protease [Myxococcales bacterium]